MSQRISIGAVALSLTHMTFSDNVSQLAAAVPHEFYGQGCPATTTVVGEAGLFAFLGARRGLSGQAARARPA
jgi:hypothetical protein